MSGLSLLAVRRATLCCGARASHCGGFSCCRTWALGARASVVVARGLSRCGTQALERRLSSYGSRALECRLSSCGARAELPRGMWDPPRPGLEPVSPALAGRFLTTAPPGKSRKPIIKSLKVNFLRKRVERYLISCLRSPRELLWVFLKRDGPPLTWAFFLPLKR